VNGVDEADQVVGVDTHLDTHAAAICDARGRVVSQLGAPASTAGYGQLLAWPGRLPGSVRSCGRWKGLGITGWAWPGTWPARASRYPGSAAASTPAGAGRARAARSAPSARPASCWPAPHPAQMRADGDREALRLLMIDRDNAIQSAKAARPALAAVLVTASAPLRERLRPLPRERRAKECATPTRPPSADRQPRILHQTLISLGQRIATLAGTAAEPEQQITGIAGDMAPGLVAAEPGPGALSAAQILLSWSHAGRIHSEAAFGMLSGTAPVPVSSGRTDRHRLNRPGDRQLNRAIHVIAVTRMRCHPATLAYLQRRRAEGKTGTDIRRCLKRYLARHLYRTLNQA
jgi:transposase